MNKDRKPALSSSYGGNRTSGDVLNHNQFTDSGRGGDDTSSVLLGDAASTEHMNAPRASAGYNRNSFHLAGREEPLRGGPDEERDGASEVWDVYADFNNTGPRYSTAFSTGQPQTQAGKLPPTPTLVEDPVTTNGKVEMVTVPALGAEWGKEEMYQMSKTGRKERKREVREEFWKSWNRGERGLCGRHFTRKVLVFFLFGLCAVIGLILAFVIPRVPGADFNRNAPIVNATGAWATAVPTIFSRSPTNFSFPAYASLQLNTQDSYLPLKFSSMHASIYDLETDKLVGTGNTASFSVPAKAFPKILIPLNFTYFVSNSSDQTWANFYNACKNRATYVNNKRPSLKIRLILDMSIVGLPSEQHASAQVSDADCPIELSLNSS